MRLRVGEKRLSKALGERLGALEVSYRQVRSDSLEIIIDGVEYGVTSSDDATTEAKADYFGLADGEEEAAAAHGAA